MTKLALLSLTLAACSHDITAFDRIDDVETARDLDVLYVYDTSANHGNYDTMAGQLDVLSAQLATVDGQLPNLRVGVVTADLGIKGTDDALAPAAFRNCAGSGDNGKLTVFEAGLSEPYLEDSRGPNGTRVRNFAGDEPGDLDAVLAQLTNPAPGKIGCEVIQPMEAMRRALDPANNPGFLRDKAQLMVVFLSNDDDCSLKTGSFLGADQPNGARCASAGVICGDEDPGQPGTYNNCRPRTDSTLVVPVSEYVSFLTDLKGSKDDVIVNTVAGPSSPIVTINAGPTPLILDACGGPGGGHKPAPRLNALAGEFGGAKVNGCTQEAAYEQITQPIIDRASSCFPSLTVDDGEDCRIIEIGGGERTELEPCAEGGEAACWYTYVDAEACPQGENIGIAIDRRSGTAPASSRIEATCFVKQ
jgi:hypothetical protein